MKYFLKYSFLFICILCFLTVGNTQQTNKKKANITASKKVATNKKKKSAKANKSKKTDKKTSKKTSKKKTVSNSSSINKMNNSVLRRKNTANLNIETADLSKLLTTNNIATPKLDTVPEKERLLHR